MRYSSTTDLQEMTEGEHLLRLDQVIHRVGLGRSTIYRRVYEGTFPPPLKIGDRAIAWRQSEVEQWIKKRPLNR